MLPPGSNPKNHGANRAQDRGSHLQDEADQRYALEYADHGEGSATVLSVNEHSYVCLAILSAV
jgi:hypothetical protein